MELFEREIVGYHGCSQDIGESILKGSLAFNSTEDSFSWLGRGVYFWQDDCCRAYEFYKYKNRSNTLPSGRNEPFVVGAVIALQNCLDLVQIKNTFFLKKICSHLIESGLILPKNKSRIDGRGIEDITYRYLDHSIFEAAHSYNEINGLPPFDTVRSVFQLGKSLTPGSQIYDRSHIQVCVRNHECIKRVFRPECLHKYAY